MAIFAHMSSSSAVNSSRLSYDVPFGVPCQTLFPLASVESDSTAVRDESLVVEVSEVEVLEVFADRVVLVYVVMYVPWFDLCIPATRIATRSGLLTGEATSSNCAAVCFFDLLKRLLK